MTTIVDEATQRKWRHVPNAISWSRFGLGVIGVLIMILWPAVLFELRLSGYLAILFAFLYLTDWVDGYIARRFQVTSEFGAKLDTIADKVVVVAPMVWLAWIGVLCGNYLLGWILVALTILRELIITLGKPIAQHRGIELKVQESGRFKMAAQCVAVVLTIWSVSRGEISLVFWGGAVLMSVYSLYDYWLIFRQAREVEAA